MENRGLSIAAMVLGIVSCGLSCIIYISVPCGVLAIIFGALELKKYKSKMAKAGFITGIIGLTIPAVILFLSFLLGIFSVMGLTASIMGLVI